MTQTSAGPRRVYQGPFVTLDRHVVTLPNQHVVELDVFHHPGAAAIVPFDGEYVTLIRQYRHAAGGLLWEIPAGTLAPGEAPEVCAVRELEEEAGLTAARWTKLGSIFTVPSFCTEVIHLFLAEELTPIDARPEADEFIDSVKKLSFQQALDWAEQGAIRDAKTLAALLHTARVLRGRGHGVF